MIDIKRRLERLEKKQYVLPTAIVTLSNGEQRRMDICEISRRFFHEPDELIRVEWIGGDCSGVICQLLACDDFWDGFRRVKHEQN